MKAQVKTSVSADRKTITGSAEGPADGRCLQADLARGGRRRRPPHGGRDHLHGEVAMESRGRSVRAGRSTEPASSSQAGPCSRSTPYRPRAPPAPKGLTGPAGCSLGRRPGCSSPAWPGWFRRPPSSPGRYRRPSTRRPSPRF
ncbi:hypothetical protein ACRAWD_20735 [Caulobacter segnis]